MGIAPKMIRKITLVTAIAGVLAGGAALSAPVTYNIDPGHTYPSFETDHMGFSMWRGKFNKSAGKIVYDKEAKAGTVEVTIDIKSVDSGHDTLNEHLAGERYFDSAKFPTATYKGKLAKFEGDKPTEVQGELTMKGVTKPLNLKINMFTCKPHPMTKKEVCGADASATFNRQDFGVSGGETKLQIAVEAAKAE
jgi:polyisoprenoid-binding protein YceI